MVKNNFIQESLTDKIIRLTKYLVGTVMAQAIALEYYAVELDRQLEIFMKMNANIQSSKNFRNMDDQELIKMVASNNIVMTNVLSKVMIIFFFCYYQIKLTYL